MTTNSQCARNNVLPAFWLRWVAMFCMMLIGAASTAQLCHSHDETVIGSRISDHRDDGGTQKPAPDSSVRCPLCVAMHAVLPVLTSLPQVALLAQADVVTPPEQMDRVFAWRFELASRPPPAMSLAA